MLCGGAAEELAGTAATTRTVGLAGGGGVGDKNINKIYKMTYKMTYKNWQQDRKKKYKPADKTYKIDKTNGKNWQQDPEEEVQGQG